MTELQEKYRRSIGRWRCAAITLFLLCLGLLIAVIVVALLKDRTFEKQTSSPDCGGDFKDSELDTSESSEPGLFDDLTVSELKVVQDYLYSSKSGLNLVRPSKAAVNTSYLFVSDLHPPWKFEALAFLNGKGPKPDRYARVVIFRGDLKTPLSEEYILGPLPNPTICELLKSDGMRSPVPYSFRPIGGVEMGSLYDRLFPEIDRKIGFILKESYEATFTNCGDKCLYFYAEPIGSAILGVKVRKMWLTIDQNVEYYSVNPLDLIILVNVDSTDSRQYFVEKIVYVDQECDSLEDFANQYKAGSIKKSKIPFPANDKDLITSLHLRGDPVPKDKKRAPRMYEPDGKRYTVKHRHVEYMQWSFDFRMSTLRGPQLYNVKFNNERIAYQVGLQEIAVYYASNNSAVRSADYIDSGLLLGTHSQSLVPGADCPEPSTFFNYAYLGETSEEPVVLQQAFCLFEQNQGVPLRRHLSYSTSEGGFYSGMEDITLILRSILTIDNYDYILDFIFHQSGALEVRALSTGYMTTSFYTPKEEPYGFELKKNTVANIHHHMFLFKTDLDINGVSNRYETLDISQDAAPHEQTTNDPNSKYHQIKFKRNLRRSEMDAVYKFNFDTPKYHVIHNEDAKSDLGTIRAFRINLDGM